jgi:hypothetical protein
VAGFRLHVGETSTRRRIGNADEMFAGRALNLPAGVARVALQRLITVGTVEFELGCAHKLRPHYAQTGLEKYTEKLLILLVGRMRI